MSKERYTANSKKKAPPKAWKKGESGNPKGRPKDGESWAGVIKEVSNMTPDDIIKLVGKNNDLGVAIAALPPKVQMKYLVVARVLAALMFEPNGSLWNSLMERAEGKIAQPISGDPENPVEVQITYVNSSNTLATTPRRPDQDKG